VLPLQSHSDGNGEPGFTGAIGLGVDREDGITERGRAAHDEDSGRYPWAIDRSFVAGGRLYTMSRFGLEADSLEDLSEQAFLRWPRSP
jgi:hypothetical protein